MTYLKYGFLVAAMAISGCSAKFSCGDGDLTDVGCQPLTMVSEKTKGELVDYREQQGMESVDNVASELEDAEDIKNHYVGQEKHGVNEQALEHVDIGTPILTQPKVASIYFAPFKDEQGDLNAGGYVYMKVSDSEWVIIK